MNEKQQQLTFGKGITNVPSDAICSDNTLEESLGMVYDDGEHRVIQKPKEFITSSSASAYYVPNIEYIHRVGHEDIFIATSVTGSSSPYNVILSFGTVLNGVYTISGASSFNTPYAAPDFQFSSIGKTLIVSDGNSINYFLWKGGDYIKLAFPLPEPDFQARMKYSPTGWFEASSASCEDIIGYDSENLYFIKDGQRGAYNDLVVGLYAKNKKSAANNKAFCEPFFVRVALELYDGTYTYIGNPILLFPNINKSSFGSVINNDKTFLLRTHTSALELYQGTDYSDYSDIVKNVVVFASKGASIYNTDGNQPLSNHESTSLGLSVANCVAVPDDGQSVASTYHAITYPADGYRNFLLCLKTRTDSDIKGDLEGDSVFYKIASLGVNPTGGWIGAETKIADHVLQNLTTQEQLQYDDYFSRSAIQADGIYAYNGRLNLYGIRRSVFRGFTYFMPLDVNPSAQGYFWLVKITTEQGPKWVYQYNTTLQSQGHYFFYPDARATEVLILKGEWSSASVVCYQKLTAHPSLNGAYFFRGLPNANTVDAHDSAPSNLQEIKTAATSSIYESLPNYLLTSEVNNPWVIRAEGYNCVGTGRILGISTTTTALSEGQFGQYPLLVFATDGIWAMSVNTEGIYTSVHPMSREVCSNPKSITQTDGAVFFASKKGLMVIVGNQVKCVSEQLSGRTSSFQKAQWPGVNFTDFLQSAFIAYDYRDSMLWIFDGTHARCWVYSIKSGTFSTYAFQHAITNVVNYYPDYLIQDSYTPHTVYSLMLRPDINNTVGEFYDGLLIVTRPMKLENALALKSITQVRHIFPNDTWIDDSEQPPVTRKKLHFRIFASNDLVNWVELSSLRGTPWKYYKFRYDFEHLAATDRFAGTVVVTEERRTNKLR